MRLTLEMVDLLLWARISWPQDNPTWCLLLVGAVELGGKALGVLAALPQKVSACGTKLTLVKTLFSGIVVDRCTTETQQMA